MKTRVKKEQANGQNRNKVLASASVSVNLPVIEEDIFREITERELQVQPGGYIPWFTQDRNFVKSLLVLAENSPTLSAVLKQKTTLALSGGLVPVSGGGVLSVLRKLKRVLGVQEKGVQELGAWLEAVNETGENILEVLEKAVLDYCTGGNIFLELVRGAGSTERLFEVYHHDFSKCLLKRDVIGEEVVLSVGINEDWDIDPKGDNAVVLPIYPQWEQTADGVERSMLHIKNYSPGFRFYGVPEWLPVKLFAELEYRGARYNISKFKNGYVPSAIVQFFGASNPNEAKDIIKRFKDCFTDTGNNNKIFAQVLSDERYRAEVQILDDKNEGNYLELLRLVTQEIVTGLRWTMSTAGVATAGKLGSNQQVRSEFEMVNNIVIKPFREQLLRRGVNVIIKEAGKWLGAWDESLSVQFGNNSPLSFVGDFSIEKVLLLEEKRKMMGLEVLDEAQREQLFNEQNRRGNDNATNTVTT